MKSFITVCLLLLASVLANAQSIEARPSRNGNRVITTTNTARFRPTDTNVTVRAYRNSNLRITTDMPPVIHFTMIASEHGSVVTVIAPEGMMVVPRIAGQSQNKIYLRAGTNLVDLIRDGKQVSIKRIQ